MEHGIVTQELGETMRDLVRFRNILAHEYLEVSPERVHSKLTTSLKHFVDFAKAVETNASV